MSIGLLVSLTATPVLADDEIDVGTEGIAIGGDDGFTVGVGDDQTGAEGTLSADGNQAEQEVSLGASGSAGGAEGGVECTINSATSGVPCEQSGGGETAPPVDPGGIGLPSDPSLPGGGGGQSPPAGGLPDGSVSDTDYSPSLGTPAGILYLTLETGDGSVPEAGVRYRNVGVGEVDHASAGVGYADKTVVVDDGFASGDRTTSTETSCELDGWLQACWVTNDPILFVSETPITEVDQIPPVVYVLVDGTALKRPLAVPGFARNVVAAEVPAESPIDLNNPPYDPYTRPFDYTAPTESVTPSVTPVTATGSPMILGLSTAVTPTTGGAGSIGVDQERSTASVAGGLSDWQNHYGAAVVASPNGVVLYKGGFVNANARLGPDTQRGSGELDLGGQPYGAGYPSGGGGSGGLPVDPSQPPSDSPPVGSSPLPADPSVPG